jgi:hypothetical protein
MSTLILRPNAVGDETNIPTQVPDSTYHWDKVGEVTADGNTTYVGSLNASAYLRDLYNLPNHSAESGVINSVTITANCYMDTAGCKWKPSLKTGGTAYDGTEITSPLYAFSASSQVWTINPKTGIAWTWTDIDALQVGISEASPVSGVTYCTQLYVTIDYTLPSVSGAGFLLRMI